MNKIKVIDLLNMISKGEEVPKKIRYKGDCWYLEQEFSNRLPYYKNGYNMDNLLTGEEKDYFSHSLNDEVEILEEEKKIPENNFNYIYSCEDEHIMANFENIKTTLKDITDYLKSKGDK